MINRRQNYTFSFFLLKKTRKSLHKINNMHIFVAETKTKDKYEV